MHCTSDVCLQDCKNPNQAVHYFACNYPARILDGFVFMIRACGIRESNFLCHKLDF